MGGMQQFFNIEINVPGMDKLDALQEKFQQTNRMARQSGQGLNFMSESTDEAADSADNASGQFGKMFGIGMNVLFLGMALSMVFGRLAGKMLGMTGAAKSFSVSVKTVLLPFFMEITPLVIKLSMALMKLPKSIKFAIGALVAFLAVMGPILMVAGQLILVSSALSASITTLALTFMSILLTVGALAMAIFFLMRAFKKFNPVIAMIAGLLATTLGIFGAVASALLGIVAVVMGINKAFKKFGNVIGTVATLVAVAAAALLAPIIGLPAAIAIALAAVITWFWNMKEEIGRAIHKAIQFILNIPKMIGKMTAAFIRKVKKLGRKAKKWFNGVADKALDAVGVIITWFKNLPKKIINATSDIASKVQSVGKDIMDGIAQGIKNAPDAIMDAIKSVAPNWVVDVLNKTGSAIQSGVSTVKTSAGKLFNLNDFIMTPNGDLIDYSRNDTIIGTQNPEALTQGGGKVEVNINDPVMKKDADIEKLVQEVEDRVNRSTRGRSTGTGIS